MVLLHTGSRVGVSVPHRPRFREVSCASDTPGQGIRVGVTAVTPPARGLDRQTVRFSLCQGGLKTPPRSASAQPDAAGLSSCGYRARGRLRGSRLLAVWLVGAQAPATGAG